MGKKKVLFIMQSLQGGGAERVTLDVIKHLNQDKFEPTILVVNYFGNLVSEVPDHVHVIKVLQEKEKTLLHPFKVIKAATKAARESDLIVGSLEMTPTYLASIVSVLANKPALGWVHTDVEQYPKTNSTIHKFLIRRLYPKLKVIVAVSNGAKQSFERLFPEIHVPVKRIYNPIRLHDIQRMANEKNELDTIEEPIILGTGRLTDLKRFDDLIKAHRFMLDHHMKNKLVILGEGEQREVLQKLIVELGVQDSVILKGFVENPYTYMRSASCFALSSKFEGFSIVLAEALSVGTPIVSTNCQSGPSEILGDGRFGRLSPVNDYKALASNIMESLKSENGVQQKSMRMNRALDFTIDKIILEYENLFNQLLENKLVNSPSYKPYVKNTS